MTLEEVFLKDLEDVFFAKDEYAKQHQLNGQEVVCIVYDGQILEVDHTLDHILDSGQGIFRAEKVVEVSQKDLEFVPFEGQLLHLDGVAYRVQSCADAAGIWQIALESYQG